MNKSKPSVMLDIESALAVLAKSPRYPLAFVKVDWVDPVGQWFLHRDVNMLIVHSDDPVVDELRRRMVLELDAETAAARMSAEMLRQIEARRSDR